MRLHIFFITFILFLFSCQDIKKIKATPVYVNFIETTKNYFIINYDFLKNHINFDQDENFILKRGNQNHELEFLVGLVNNFYNNQRVKSYHRGNLEEEVRFFSPKDYIKNIEKASITFEVPESPFKAFFFTKEELLKGINEVNYLNSKNAIKEIKKIAVPITEFIQFFALYNKSYKLFDPIYLPAHFSKNQVLEKLLKELASLESKLVRLNKIFSKPTAKKIKDFQEKKF